MNEKNDLKNVIINILTKNSKFSILKLAYAYNKKTKYPHQNGLAKMIIDSWGFDIPEQHYSSYEDIQVALAKLEFNDLSTYMEYILNLIKRNCGKYLFTQPKYKSLRFLYVKFKDYYKSIDDDDIIGWIQFTDKELYNDIKSDTNWRTNFFVHINKFHTAFHNLLIYLDNDRSNSKDNVLKLYSSLFENSSLSKDEISVLKLDTKIIAKFNDLRNYHSKAHPSFIESRPQISADIGILFLKDVALLVKKIKRIFKLEN